MQGYRVNMEDQHIIDKMSTLPDHTLLAIMDGKFAFCNFRIVVFILSGIFFSGHAGKVAACQVYRCIFAFEDRML